MRKLLTLNKVESAGLRQRLEDHLISIFVNNTINKYQAGDKAPPVLKVIQHCPDHVLAYPQIKMAFNIWLGMRAADRHAVLSRFNMLYAALPSTNLTNGKTLTFCALFVNELASIFNEAMDRPE